MEGDTMTRGSKCSVAAAALVLSCTFGLGTAKAANLLATESAADVASLVPDANWDRTPFTSISSGESADGSGAFLANTTGTGSALVVLTEGPGGANSDWLELVYSGAGNPGTESVTAHWRSDSDPGGLPALPAGVTPEFLAETGGVQDVTSLLALSAGGTFPSNITVQVQSDAPEAPVPEPTSLALLGAALAGLGLFRSRKRA
jgi:PEP-CTERM motif